MSTTKGVVGHSPVLRVAAHPSEQHREGLLDAARDATESVSVVATGPTGVEAVEPLVLATASGATAFLDAPTESKVADAIAALEEGQVPETDGPTVEHDPGTATLPVPEDGPLSVGRRRVLGPCGWVAPTAPADHEFVAPDRDAGAATDVGLLGRGRGDAVANESVAGAWERAREADGEPVVVVSANEADPRPRADRTLLASTPLAVLDGAAAVAEYVDADDVVVYLNERDSALQNRVHDAAEAAAADLPVVPQVVAGPDEYRAGEPTAALEAMEGSDRIEPRVQPPPPSEYGLYGRPTVVHTPRTVAQVRQALANPAAFDPDDSDPGTRLVTVTGDVAAPATVELPTGGSLAAVREAVDLEGRFKMACVGGPLGGLTRDLSVAPAAPSLDAAGLGTDGVVELLGERRCAVATAGERARFAADENSGRCVPGREGTRQLADLLRNVYEDQFDPEKIRELGRVMARTANCQVGAHAPRPVLTAIDEFGAEFRAHADGRCPADTCTEQL